MVGLERSTYYDIKHHRPSDREIRHLLLEDAITGIFQRSRATYGVRRIRAAHSLSGPLVSPCWSTCPEKRVGVKFSEPRMGHPSGVTERSP